jgi:hypothetical protein
MRTPLFGCLIAFAALLAVATGCASRPAPAQNISVAPNQAEVPKIPGIERKYTAVVVAERDPRLPRVPLVGKLEAPPLTPEEQAALGEQPRALKLLPFNSREFAPGSPVAPWRAGVVTATARTASGPTILLADTTRVADAAVLGSDDVAVDTRRTGIAGRLTADRRMITAGPSGRSMYGADDRESHISAAHPTIDY